VSSVHGSARHPRAAAAAAQARSRLFRAARGVADGPRTGGEGVWAAARGAGGRARRAAGRRGRAGPAAELAGGRAAEAPRSLPRWAPRGYTGRLGRVAEQADA